MVVFATFDNDRRGVLSVAVMPDWAIT